MFPWVSKTKTKTQSTIILHKLHVSSFLVVSLPSVYSVRYHCLQLGPQVSSLDYQNGFITDLVASSHGLDCPPSLINLSNVKSDHVTS